MSRDVNFENLRILVVEDHPSQRSAITNFLKRYQCRDVHEAADGEEALMVITKAGRLDLILCDIDVKPLSGLQLVKAIRAGLTRTSHDTPVVILTAHANPELSQATTDLHVNGYAVKPVRPSQLAEKIEQIARGPLPIKPVGPQNPASRGAEEGEPAAGDGEGEVAASKAREDMDELKRKVAEKVAPRRLEDLKAGAIVAEDVMTIEGVVVLPRGTMLTEESIEIVHAHSGVDQVLVLE